MQREQQLETLLASSPAAPFLFIGSGLSRRYVELPNWRGLLEHFAKHLKHPYQYYHSKANGDLPMVASLIAEEFHDTWWSSPAFAESRDTDETEITQRDSCLKVEVARYVKRFKYTPGRNTDLDQEIGLLKKATIDGIITTNWDLLVESIFPDYKTFIGQDEILASTPQMIGEIYKIHGSSLEPNSLVLTAEDYNQFNRLNPYLVAKLLTIFVEHPVIFLGYSLQDTNIRAILTQLAQCLSPEKLRLLGDRLIIVDRSSNGTTLEASSLHVDDKDIPVTVLKTTSFEGLFSVLGAVKRKFPARLLRKMKDHLYQLIASNDPRERLAVVDIEEAENFEELEVVYGVGVKGEVAEIGYQPVQTEDLLKDVIEPTSNYDGREIATQTLPRLVKGNVKYVPCFRYLAKLNGDDSIAPTVGRLAQQGRSRFVLPTQYESKKQEVRRKYSNLTELMKDNDAEHAIFQITLLEDSAIDIEELRRFIVSNMHLLDSSNQMHCTYFKSLICFYDWLKYSTLVASSLTISTS